MSLVTGEIFGLVFFGLIVSVIPFLVCLLIAHILMPESVLDRYWKEPYFRPFELMLFSGWSFFAPMRTVMFLWMFQFPRAGRRRGIVEPHRLVPRWYRIAAIVINVSGIVIVSGVFSTLIGFFAYSHFIGNPMGWDAHVALAITIGGIVFLTLRPWWLKRRDAKPKRGRSSGRKKKPSA